MRDGHAQKWTHAATGKTFDINHRMRAVNSKGVVGGVMFRKDNLIYDAILFYKTNPIFQSQLKFSFLQN